MRRHRTIGALAGALALVLGLVTAGAVASTPDVGGATAATSEAAVLAYWTPERMRAARPAPRPSPGRASPHLRAAQPAVGKPGSVGASERGSDGTGAVAVGAATPAAAAGYLYDYPYPFSRRAVERPLYSLFPYRTVGKVFFTRGQYDYECSGASVNSSPRQIVFTAGHCLYGEGQYSYNLVFKPAYRFGRSPYGTFRGVGKPFVPPAYVQSEDSTRDFGAFIVAPNQYGQTLQDAVGYLGFAWNLSAVQHWDVLGYPAGYPFSGVTMQVCEASYAGTDAGGAGEGGTAPIAIGCDMTGGSSGGPWVRGLGRNQGGNQLNGVVSYGYDDEPLGTYGPYFDTAAELVRCQAMWNDRSLTSC
jgi:V8-like Glu-specific endopeptidase